MVKREGEKPPKKQEDEGIKTDTRQRGEGARERGGI